jgi:hypothetical protein
MKSCSLDCAVTAYATSRLSFDEVNLLRKQSDNLPGALGNSVLRHSDEQTLAALATVRDALNQFDSCPEDFRDWGVVCSSRYLGRSAFAQALTKFAIDGPWNVSVQVVPNRSLHSPASMVGLALGCHGPCVGVGGGLDGETDAWITATSLLDQQSLPGMWLVFSGWEPDEHVDLEGNALSESRCTALVMALQPMSVPVHKARLQIQYDSLSPAAVEVPAKTTAFRLFERFLSEESDQKPIAAMLGGGLRADLSWAPVIEASIPLSTPISVPQKKAA